MELLYFLVLFCISSFSIATADDTYNNFVQCLTTNSVPTSEIQEIVYNPTSPSFTPILQAYIRNQRFNTSTTPKPNIIITPKVESHVQASVICSKKLGLNLKIRSGGHDYEGVSYVSFNGPSRQSMLASRMNPPGCKQGRRGREERRGGGGSG